MAFYVDCCLVFFFVQTFSTNPYFEDKKLTKAFSFSDEGTTNITGTTITWKEGVVSTIPIPFRSCVSRLFMFSSNASLI